MKIIGTPLKVVSIVFSTKMTDFHMVYILYDKTLTHARAHIQIHTHPRTLAQTFIQWSILKLASAAINLLLLKPTSWRGSFHFIANPT